MDPLDLNSQKEMKAEVLRLRLALLPEAFQAQSKRASQNLIHLLLSLGALEPGKIGAVYRVPEKNPRNELDLESMILAPELSAVSLAYPRVVSPADGVMEFALAVLKNGERESTDFKQGPFRLYEPRPEIPAIEPTEIDWMVVPGTVFSKSGGRAGQGLGFYDRFLAKNPGILRIGVCFELQLREGLPLNVWDQKMDWVVTEKEIFEVIDPCR